MRGNFLARGPVASRPVEPSADAREFPQKIEKCDSVGE